MINDIDNNWDEKDHLYWDVFSLLNRISKNDNRQEWFVNMLSKNHLQSREIIVKHIKDAKYKSVLDCGAGVGLDFYNLKKEGIDSVYTGLDCTRKFVEHAEKNNIPICMGNVLNIDFMDNSFEMVYCRHLIEHLNYYNVAIKEMVRVAEVEVVIIFFIPPTEDPDYIKCKRNHYYNLYENKYNSNKIEYFLKNIKKVKNFYWKYSPDKKEKFLHILLK